MANIEITRDEARLIMINLRISQIALKNSIEVMEAEDKSLLHFKEMLQDNILLSDKLEDKINESK